VFAARTASRQDLPAFGRVDRPADEGITWERKTKVKYFYVENCRQCHYPIKDSYLMNVSIEE
ncbi:hypothetical protein, partial [Paenibacillus sp. oral taxon 786]|uniref:hypothetical protein n=1 Tax=Paenibacillus sp. oral taxon 786 TaxID=652715 RepID=UPI001E35D3CA